MSTDSRIRRVRNETRVMLVELWTRQDRTSKILAALLLLASVLNMVLGNWIIALLILMVMGLLLINTMLASFLADAVALADQEMRRGYQ